MFRAKAGAPPAEIARVIDEECERILADAALLEALDVMLTELRLLLGRVQDVLEADGNKYANASPHLLALACGMYCKPGEQDRAQQAAVLIGARLGLRFGERAS